MTLSELQKKILSQKDFDLENKEEIEKFLLPNWDRDLLKAENIKDIEKSIERIKLGIERGENIIIYADYDSDGIPGAVILNDFFEKINYKNFSVYIPDRHKEGYGLNKKAIENFIKEKVSLIITVDIGITNLEEIAFAEENNINIIVTDHHLPILDEKGKQILPKAFSIINTKQEDDNYEEKFLSGAATAWKLVNAFLNKYRKDFDVRDGWEKWLLDMVGISTIADLVPLKNENRLLAKYGLLVLKKSKRPGLQKILANSKIIQKNISEDDIAFYIAPRINSASRIANPKDAFYALLQNDNSLLYAELLEEYNDERKRETSLATSSIDFKKLEKENILLLGNQNWTPGILGLIASKVAEETCKTTFVWGRGEDEEILKGSVRGVEDGENVVEIMTACQDLLENFGGHEAAGGFALHKDNLEKFQNFLKAYKKEEKKKVASLERVKEKKKKDIKDFIDIELEKINKNLLEEIKIFAPFGIENPKIVFRIKIKENHILTSKRFGKKKEHLEININGLRAIEFFAKEEREEFLLLQKEFFINVEADNFRKDILVKFLK